MWWRAAVSASAPVAERVHGDGNAEHERYVERVLHGHAVAVPDPEPLLRHAGDLLTVALDLVLVVGDLPVHLQVGSAVDLDVEPVPQPDQRLLHLRLGAADLDRDGVTDRELLLPDPGDLVAAEVLQHPRVADPQRLAVDPEALAAVLVLDP